MNQLIEDSDLNKNISSTYISFSSYITGTSALPDINEQLLACAIGCFNIDHNSDVP